MNNPRLLSTADWHKRFEQQAMWTTAIRNHLVNVAKIGPNARVLEVGCGTGAVLSRSLFKDHQAFGIDINPNFLNFAQKRDPSVLLSQGDGHLLPYSHNVFDLVYCHYLLLWVEDPVRILQECKRVGKDGGRVMIFAEPDYGGRIDAPLELEKLGKAQTESLKLQGANPFIGRDLLKFAHSAGLKVLEFGVLGSQSTSNMNPAFLNSEWEMLNYDLAGILSSSELKAYQQIDRQAWAACIRVLFIPTFFLYAEII